MSLWLWILVGDLPFLALAGWALVGAIQDERDGLGLILPHRQPAVVFDAVSYAVPTDHVTASAPAVERCSWAWRHEPHQPLDTSKGWCDGNPTGMPPYTATERIRP